MRLFLVHFLCT